MKRIEYNWGWSITIVYSSFALATLGFVVFALTQKVDLVQDDYYEQSLNHDATMIARSNAKGLGALAGIMLVNGNIVVQIPAEQAKKATGTVLLYKASMMGADKLSALKVDDSGSMVLNASELMPGTLSVIVRWSCDGKEYEMQQAVTIEKG